MEILFLLLLLQIKHCIADFNLQTYQQTIKKGVYGNPIGISHTIDHMWTSMVALLIFNLWFPINIFTLLWVVALEGLIHYHVDWFKVHFGTKNMQTSECWAQFGDDQMAHQLTYIWMVWQIII